MARREEDQRSYPRSLDGVLRMSVEHANKDSANSNVFNEMSEERKQWLQEALTSITEDSDGKRMMACVQILETTQCDNDEDDISSKENAFEALSMIVDNLDNANDFHKIGGFQVLLKYLNIEQSSLRWRAADLLAVCVQNNPYCQDAAMELNMIPTLNTLLKTDPSELVKVKALYAISCLTRDYKLAEEAFLRGDGFSLLIQAMQGASDKLVTKSVFMLQHMLTTNPSHKETLFNMGLIEQLAGLLQGPERSPHEHILRLLVNFVTDFPRAIDECNRPKLDLEHVLRMKMSNLKDEDPEINEEMILHCDELLQICFGKKEQKHSHETMETTQNKNQLQLC